MTRPVIYMSHPVSGVADVVPKATAWLRWLRRRWPGVTFIAPWISDLVAGDDDSDPSQRAEALVNCVATVARCNGLVLVGNKVSRGMHIEANAAGYVVDLVSFFSRPVAAEYPPGAGAFYDELTKLVDGLSWRW